MNPTPTGATAGTEQLNVLARPMRVSRRAFTQLVGGGAAGIAIAGAMPHHASAEEPNLLLNGSFDEVDAAGRPTAWTFVGGPITSVMDPVHTAGGLAAQLSDPSDAQGTLLRSAPVVAEEFVVHTVTGWFLASEGTSYLRLDFWDADGAAVLFRQVPVRAAEGWQQATLSLLAPEGTATVTAAAYQGVAGTASAVVDDFVLTRPAPEPIHDYPLITPGHPRLYFTADDLPGFRARTIDPRPSVTGTPMTSLWSQILADAENVLTEESFTQGYVSGVSITYPLPPQEPGYHPPPPGYTSGDYPYWNALSEGIRRRMEALAVAYAGSDDPRFAARLKEYVLAMAEWSTWTDPWVSGALRQQADLETGNFAVGVAFGYDMVHHLLTEQERTSVRNAIERNALVPMWIDLATPLPNNKFLVRASGLASAAAVLKGEYPEADKYLTRAVNTFNWFLDLFKSGMQEGYAYTAFALDNIVESAAHVTRVTGEGAVLANPFLDETQIPGQPSVVPWTLRGLVPGATSLAPVSDSGAANFFLVTFGILAEQLQNGHAGWYLSEARPSGTAVKQFLYTSPDLPVTPPTDGMPASAVLDKIGWASFRSGWTADDELLVLVANDSRQSHNHHDQNSFLIGTNGGWIASDPGGRSYLSGPKNTYTVTDGHSTLYVDGLAQGIVSAGGFGSGRGSMTPGVVSPACCHAVGHAAQAYERIELDRFDRHVISVPGVYHAVIDEIAAPEPHVYDWALYSGVGVTHLVDGEVLAPGATADGRVLEVHSSTGQLRVTQVIDEPRPVRLEVEQGAEEYGPIIKISTTAPSVKANFTSLLQASPRRTAGLHQAESLPVTSNGPGTKTQSMAGASVVFVRATQAGDWMEFTFELSEANTYDLRAWFLLAPVYGQVQVSVDGDDVGSVVDTYASDIELGPAEDLGQVSLAAGQHTLRVTIVGQNPDATGWFTSIDAFQFIGPGESPEPTPLPELEADPVITATGTGMRVRRDSWAGPLTDVVAIRTAEGPLQLDGVRGDGVQLLASRNLSSNVVERYAVSNGTQLFDRDRVLVSGRSPADVGALHLEDGTWHITVQTGRIQRISLHVGDAPAEVLVDGTPARAPFDRRAKCVRVLLEPGSHTVTTRPA